MPKSRGRRQPARRSRHQPSPAQRGTGSLVRHTLNSFQPLLDEGSAFDLEKLVSELIGLAWLGRPMQRVGAAELLADRLLQNTQLGRHPAGGLIVAGLAAVGPPTAKVKAAQVAAHPSPAWVLPDWLAEVGHWHYLGGHLDGDEFDERLTLTLSFTRSDGQERMLLLAGADAVAREITTLVALRKDPPSPPGEVPRDIIEMMLEWLELCDITADLLAADVDDEEALAGHRFLAHSLLSLAAAGSVAPPSPSPRLRAVSTDTAAGSGGLDPGAVVDPFLSSEPGQRLIDRLRTDGLDDPRGSAEFITGTFVQFAVDYCGREPLSWGPRMLADYLLDWAPRKVLWEDEDARSIGTVLQEWLTYLDTRSRLPDGALPRLRAQVDEHFSHTLDDIRSGSGRGPAAEIIAQLLGDGVDIGDRAAVDAWISRYNASLR